MSANNFMVAVILVQALTCSCAYKRSFTTRPSPTKPGVCASNPCVHGQCQPYPSMNTYICKCIHGATGRNCEKETDMCLFNPCVFGTCSGHGINFTCTCDKGYTGKICDKEIDMCIFNPCVFGTCSGHGLHYTCTCDKEWTGKLCNSQVQHINGGWTSWTTWSTCTLTCGIGTSSRSRSCTNPAPQNNGAQCSGPATDTQSCNSNVCPPTPTIGTIPTVKPSTVCSSGDIMYHLLFKTSASHPSARHCNTFNTNSGSEALLLAHCQPRNTHWERWTADLKVVNHCTTLAQGDPIGVYINGRISVNLFAVFWRCKPSSASFEIVYQLCGIPAKVVDVKNSQFFLPDEIYTIKW